MSFEIDEEIIIPRPFLGRPGFDLRQINFVPVERGEHRMQRAHAVLDGEKDRRPVLSRRSYIIGRQDQEPGDIVRIVLDIFLNDPQVIDFGRQGRGNAGRILFFARDLRRPRGRRHLELLGLGQMIHEPVPALAEDLRIRIDIFDFIHGIALE